MAKKTWGIMLLCFLALLFIPPKAVAADSGVCGDHLSWEVDDAGTLTIKGTGDMYDGMTWNSSEVHTVVIEPGVTSIGGDAFRLQRNLIKVSIPESVTRIGGRAFAWCSNLNDVTIPNGVTIIDSQAFQGCAKLASIRIPNSVVEIGEFAFYNCDSLTNIAIPASVTNIGMEAFSACNSLSKIDVDSKNSAYRSTDGVLFDKGQTTLLAFPGARGSSYAIPSGVSIIETGAFTGCKNLTVITIPDSVTSVRRENAGFASCSSLQEIRVAEGNPAYVSINGVLFNKDVTTLVGYPGAYGGSYIVPNSVITIPVDTFEYCENLSDITILNSVTSIGAQAFLGCSNLTQVVISGSVTKLGSNIFLGCPIKDVYYGGDETQWNAIEGVKDALSDSVTVHYRFDDVPSTAYYADAVNWAVAQGITNGTTETTFSPNNTCTTANIITFLWRANGSPEPKVSNPFSDVQTGQYYAKAAVWAYEKDMVTGRTFGGNANCTRAATMKYLWILSGRPSSSSNPFTDVSNNADYAQAVAWAVAQGVTNGKTATTFAPDDTCTRGQIATFLLRYYMR